VFVEEVVSLATLGISKNLCYDSEARKSLLNVLDAGVFVWMHQETLFAIRLANDGGRCGVGDIEP